MGLSVNSVEGKEKRKNKKCQVLCKNMKTRRKQVIGTGKDLFNQRKTTKPAERRRIFIRMNHSRPTKTKPPQVSNIRTGCTGPGRQERSAIRTWKVTSLEGLYFFPSYCINIV